MAATATSDTTHGVSQALQRARTEPAYGAFLLLRVGFTVLPILMGLDKFANLMTNWEHYLAPGSSICSRSAPIRRCSSSA